MDGSQNHRRAWIVERNPSTGDRAIRCNPDRFLLLNLPTLNAVTV